MEPEAELDVTGTLGVLDEVDGMRAAFMRYASPRRRGAPYVVVGSVNIPGRGVVAGILAFAENELFAHLLRRHLLRYALTKYGAVRVRQTEWHPRGVTFAVEPWRRLVRSVDPAMVVGSDRVVITPGAAPELYAELLSA